MKGDETCDTIPDFLTNIGHVDRLALSSGLLQPAGGISEPEVTEGDARNIFYCKPTQMK
jgi:hypothetical protein